MADTEWIRLGRPDSASDLPARERRRLPASAYLDSARRHPIVGPDDARRALDYLQRCSPAVYLAGCQRLALICRARGIPMPPVLAATPTPTAALDRMRGAP